MSRGNPSVERAASVLALLSAEPERGFTLAEIVRQTELSKATVHALLASLTSNRWLLRYPAGPSYRLGPGLIALGEAARQGYPELPYAQDKMRELGTQLGLECMASAVVGSEIVILAKSGAPVPLSSTAAIGQPGQLVEGELIDGEVALIAVDRRITRRPIDPDEIGQRRPFMGMG